MSKKINKLVIDKIVSGYGGMSILKGVSMISQEEIVVIIGLTVLVSTL